FTDEGSYPDFSRHQIDIYTAKKQGFDIDIEMIKRNMDEESFRQEFCCEFIDESTSYFPYELIKSGIGETVFSQPEIEASVHYMGVDVGRRRDLTVIYILRQLGRKLYTAEITLLYKKKFSIQKEIIIEKINEFNIKRGRIDETGLGMQLAEEINEMNRFVEGVTFSNSNKERIVVNLKKAFENRVIEIPDDRMLITDIHSIKKSVTPSNLVRFDAKRTEQGHADRFWALGLAYDCLAMPVPSIPEITTRKRKSIVDSYA
ncbi:hypothetical protein ACFLS9_09120, partial [Bacteroidota bacterium]